MKVRTAYRCGAACVAVETEDRDASRWLAEFVTVTAPLEATLKEQPYFAGISPNYADYVLFSVFQYARLGSPDEFLGEGTALRRWRDELALMFDGLGNRYPGYPAICI